MRSKDATFLALMQSDQLDLVLLVEIETAGDPLRYAIDTEARTWNGVTWSPTAGGLAEIQESAEREVPSLQLVLQNMDGVLGPLAHPDAGGEDLRGRRVTIRQANRGMLTGGTAADLVIEWTFFVNAYSWIGRSAVAFDLGVFPAEDVQVPERSLQGIRCRWIYQGAHCGDSSGLPTCARTVADCRRHFGDDPLRFGGFPTAADARALRVQ